DGHSVLTMVMDSKGALTVITGSHGWSPIHPGFLAVFAKNPRDISQWNLPSRIGNGQSYVDAVVNSKDDIFIAYRVHPQLWVQKYDRAAGKWQDPIRLLEYTPGRNPDGTCGYTVFYHHIFVDRQDNIYVKAVFNDFNTGLKGKFPLMWFVSRDGGSTWKIAQTNAMEQAITR
ncbi:MAG: hypothetical protein J6Q65_00425, partial [Lentisphaeria bacterium]|nr:hypothetical protein [Lentisphaeria bacterium]